MRFVSWDIETALELPKNADLQKHMPLGTTCSAMIESGQDPDKDVRLWWAGMMQPTLLGPKTYAPQMSKAEAQEMVLYLGERYLNGYAPLTWNGLGFEWLEMAFETGWWQECKVMALLHVDMFFHLFCLIGYFVKLDRACRGMGLPGKASSGMTGADAPMMWKKDPDRVLAYVSEDVTQPLEFSRRVIEKGMAIWAYKWTDEAGTVNAEMNPYKKGFGHVELTEWLPVFKAKELPLPDVSGFSRTPPPRDELLGWTQDLPSVSLADREEWKLQEGIFDIAISLGL